MPKIKDISTCLEEFAPLSLQEGYDNAGLIVGDENMEVKGVLLCIDSTEEVVKEAKQKNCNLIIAHHPIVFKGLKRITTSHYVERTVRTAIKNDIAIYASHTNLDNTFEGVNRKISSRLELNNLSILQPAERDGNTGAGMIGDLDKALDEGEFLEYVRQKMDLKVIRHSPYLNKKIERVALCGGAGSFLIHQAAKSGADAYISGDIKYHEFFEANEEILILDIGHYESERFTSEIFHQVISDKFPNIALQFSEVDTNPINYFI
jgi:dinuclear metal center YbgI/SA1388 family protein